MPDIFLSYINEDAEFAGRLKLSLERRNYTADAVDHHAAIGESWTDALADKLRDARAIVIIISKAHYQVGLPRYEVAAATAYGRARGKPLIIPVVIGDVKLPPFLQPFEPISTPTVDPDPVDIASLIADTLETHTGLIRAKEDQQKERQKQVEENAATYVNKSLAELSAREKKFRRVAYLWYFLAYASLIATLSFAMWRFSQPTTITDWPALVEQGVLALVVLGSLVALANFSFLLGKSFMVESLRNSDRKHAISYGEFYLKARGAQMEWHELKEAFQQWNIDKGSNLADAEAECNTVTGLKQALHAASPLLLS
ncbi:toll/interleukin-1 receptor domain-containing protein [Azotobacter beijerinckii]|uniref:TIR domain-containing protein n=1 Tax=Azotobacter beijerinckii TaxID=170623 RepID=A0A1I1C289_9GAMM|nr:toll/interleukin-1 receptor domain-containing protein [Azotobacter beijerinckii]SFB56126.1 TIR domain-containing protein [Azotobacter beijerinckii]